MDQLTNPTNEQELDYFVKWDNMPEYNDWYSLGSLEMEQA